MNEGSDLLQEDDADFEDDAGARLESKTSAAEGREKSCVASRGGATLMSAVVLRVRLCCKQLELRACCDMALTSKL